MKDLAIRRCLNEETRKQGVAICLNHKICVLSMHITNNEVIFTDNKDYTKIYAIYSLDYFNAIDI